MVLCTHHPWMRVLSWDSAPRALALALALGPSCVTHSGHCTSLVLSFTSYKMRIIILALLASWGDGKGHVVIPVSSRHKGP